MKKYYNNLDQDLGHLKGVAKLIIKKLEGKRFDIVSFHSNHNRDSRVMENCSLKSAVPIVIETTVQIAIGPKRYISFRLHEDPVITFESDRQIKIVRKMPRGDTLTKIILIN